MNAKGITEKSKTNENKQGIGPVETKYFTFAHTPRELMLESGERLGPITLAYEIYGTLNQDKSNAILILHALTGNAHAAGYHPEDKDPGWWDNMIGPGKAFDTDKYFVICSNVIGGCKGSTGPASINPKTKKPYGLDFPLITIKDMVNAQVHLIRYLGINQLLCIAGGSMGGMQVLQWAVSYPEMVRAAIPIATTAKHSPQQIAFNEVGRQAVMADPEWRDGHYYGLGVPARGLAVARMVGHITYMSDISMEEKFGRKVKEERPDKKFSPDSEAASGVRFLVIAFKSDWLYPIYQSKEIVRACKQAQLDVSYYEINSTYGHDAFLLEVDEEEHFIKNFLRKLSDE